MCSRHYPTGQTSLVQKQTQQMFPECLTFVYSAGLQVLRGPHRTPEGQRRVHGGGMRAQRQVCAPGLGKEMSVFTGEDLPSSVTA